MTNDASQGGRPPANARDWESAALQRVAERRVELRDTDRKDSEQGAQDWERRALECLRRYFRTQR
jgi:hypothetical protein